MIEKQQLHVENWLHQAKVQLADKGIPTELAEILILTDADSCKKVSKQ